MSEFDPQRAEAFAGRLLQTLNNGALCLMISIGHRTYLAKAGFGSVEKNELAHDLQNNWYVVRK